MDVGPVEVVVLEFPGQRADPAVTGVLADVVSRGYAAVLDLVFVAHTPDGSLRVTDAGDNLDGVGLGALQPGRQPLISRDDLDLMRDSLRPGTCAAVIAYEHRWPERLAAAARDADGQLALHVQVPHDAVAAAVAAAVP
jgi:Family of unknown function (DUF6325)